MAGRRIRSESEARTCLAAVEESGMELAGWARTHDIDGRSLNAWRINLGRREADRRPCRPVRLVELVAGPARPGGQYVIRVGDMEVEVDSSFDDRTLQRLLRVVAAC